MGRLFLLKLEGEIYTCKYCDTHIALEGHILEKAQNGFNWILDKMVNVFLGEKYDKDMSNGTHTLKDVYCVGCCSLLGFKYEVVPPVVNNMPEPQYREGDFSVKRAEFLEPDGSGYPPVVEDHGGGN